MSNYGEIPSPWENERSITFSVPLHLREGAVRVWLEKPDESGRIVRSNNVNFTVVPFTALYPDEDDGFFQKAIKRIKRAILLNT